MQFLERYGDKRRRGVYKGLDRLISKADRAVEAWERDQLKQDID